MPKTTWSKYKRIVIWVDPPCFFKIPTFSPFFVEDGPYHYGHIIAPKFHFCAFVLFCTGKDYDVVVLITLDIRDVNARGLCSLLSLAWRPPEVCEKCNPPI